MTIPTLTLQMNDTREAGVGMEEEEGGGTEFSSPIPSAHRAVTSDNHRADLSMSLRDMER